MEKPLFTYKLTETEIDSFFIGANTEKGFVRSYDFSSHETEFDRLLILKGGPGTGKSTFMKNAALKYGTDIKFYYCSSDPDSLDGAVFKKGEALYGICDGTAPHVTEMNYPGAVSEIVNLGSYWNSSKLSAHREEIIELSGRKSACFSAAYTYLKSAAEAEREMEAIALNVCNSEKAINAASRLIAKYKIKKGERNTVYTEAFSMKGCIAYDTYFRKAEEIYYVNDAFGIANLFLKYIDKLLSDGKDEYTAIISPTNTSVISGIYIDSASVLITHSNYSELEYAGKAINTKRFLNPDASEYKNRFSLGARCRNALTSGAAEYLSRAHELHFTLEDIYVKAMNFRQIDKLQAKLFDSGVKQNNK